MVFAVCFHSSAASANVHTAVTSRTWRRPLLSGTLKVPADEPSLDFTEPPPPPGQLIMAVSDPRQRLRVLTMFRARESLKSSCPVPRLPESLYYFSTRFIRLSWTSGSPAKIGCDLHPLNVQSGTRVSFVVTTVVVLNTFGWMFAVIVRRRLTLVRRPFTRSRFNT